MLGILTGMKITLKHFFGPKVTRLYPYQKRVLPERTRGLIHYVLDDKGQFKCEGCLLCEKICPPQAITINSRPRETHRDRPQTLAQATWGNFKRSRRSLLSRQGRPALAAEEAAAGAVAIDWDRVTSRIGDRRDGGALVSGLTEVQEKAGYLPRYAVASVADEAGVDLSTAYGFATGLPGFHTASASKVSVAVCQCPVCRNSGARNLAAALESVLSAKGLALATKPHHRCLGDAVHAPVLRVGERTYGGATPQMAEEIVREFLNAGGSSK